MEFDIAVVRAYLLGDLPPDDCKKVEESYFSDDAYFEAVEACEDELFRDYARNELTARERKSFAARYLGAEEGRERARFAAELATAAGLIRGGGAAPIGGRFRALWNLAAGRRWTLLAAVCAALAIGFALSLQFELRRVSTELASLRSALPTAEPASRSAEPVVLAFQLQPDALRGSASAMKLLLLPTQQGNRPATVRLHMDLEPDQRVERYRGVLRARPSGEVWSALVTRGAADDFVEIGLPATTLAPGDYVLTLDADPTGPVHESYAFRIQFKQ